MDNGWTGAMISFLRDSAWHDIAKASSSLVFARFRNVSLMAREIDLLR